MTGINNQNGQTGNLEGIIMGLMKELAKLAPHPNRPDYTGPLFISGTSEFKPPAEYEGMMGSFLMESTLQSEFTSAATNVAETVSNYITDRKQSPLMRSFNTEAHRAALTNAYFADLPKRLGLESWIAHEQRKLYSLRKNALRLDLSYAA